MFQCREVCEHVNTRASLTDRVRTHTHKWSKRCRREERNLYCVVQMNGKVVFCIPFIQFWFWVGHTEGGRGSEKSFNEQTFRVLDLCCCHRSNSIWEVERISLTTVTTETRWWANLSTVRPIRTDECRMSGRRKSTFLSREMDEQASEKKPSDNKIDDDVVETSDCWAYRYRL